MLDSNLSMNEAFLQKLTVTVHENMENEQFGVEDLSRQMGISRSQLHRKLKLIKGKSVSQFIREVRLEEAMKMLKQEEATASEIAYRVGFSSPSYFYKCFQNYYGFPPGEVKKMKKDNESLRPIRTRINTSWSQRKNETLFRWSFLVLLTILIISLAYYFLTSKTDPSTLEKSIAVLPFKNLSYDEDNQHFTDGLVDDLLGRLALIEEFEVTSRTSSETFRGQEDKKIAEIAAELGASYIVEGSVQRQEDQVRIIVQLIDATNDDHIWVKTFDRNLSDVFEVQSEIAMQIASGLNMALSEEQEMNLQKNKTENIKALELYHLGRHNWGKRTRDGLNNSIGYFEQAIEEDPNYATAYAGMADSYYLKVWFDTLSMQKENRRKALEFANKALEIDPQCVEAVTVLATVNSFVDYNWSIGEELFHYGISLNSNYSTLHHRFAEHLDVTGRSVLSREHINKALSLDPLSFIVRVVSAELYYDNGFFKESRDELLICKDLNLNNFHWRTHDLLFLAYCQLENGEAALDIYKQIEGKLRGKYDEIYLDNLYQESGYKALIRRYIEIADDPHTLAILYGLYGDNENCLFWLEERFDSDGIKSGGLLNLFDFKRFYDNPRFIALMNKMGLPWKPEDNE